MRWALAGIGLVILAGCGEAPSADPVIGKKTAEAAPKSAKELPASMPPEARASAAAAIGQAKAQQDMNNDPARAKALQMMKQQHGG
jgi:hypothetical protein